MAVSSDNSSSDYIYPLPATVTVGLLASLLAVVTTLSNALTLLAFALSRSLRNFGDYFILNLAVADLAIGLLSIPPYIPYMLTSRWTMGKAYCLFWLLWDYVTPAASAFNMCVISIDRYLLVAHPIWYRQHQSTRLLLLMILTPWVIVTLVYGPSILLWEVLAGKNTIAEGECYVPYAHDLSFLLFGSFIEFMFPFLVMIVINLLIFLNIRRRSRRRVAARGALTVPGHAAASQSRLSGVQVAPAEASLAGAEENPSTNDTNTHSSRERNTVQEDPGESVHNEDSEKRRARVRQQQQAAKTRAEKARTTASNNFNRDRKAARSLFILVFIFTLCWLPYEVLALVSAVCSTCIDPVLFDASFWLLWVNSTVNPILYPLLHRRFRDAFFTILRKARCRH